MKAFIATACILTLGLWTGVGLSGEGHGHTQGHHAHGSVEVVDLSKAPTVRLIAEKDQKSGWNILVLTTNFTFAPQQVNRTHREGEGHAHLYVDGQKQRIYCPAVHLDGLAAGQHTLRVTLNGNDHREYAVEGKVVEDTVLIEQ